MNLLCDACGEQQPVEALTEALVGTPCPRCNANMLTQQDYDDGRKMFEAIKVLEALGLAKLMPERTAETFGINPHGGKLTITPPNRSE